MTKNEKFSFVLECENKQELNANEFKRICELANDNDSEIRLLVSETLACFNTQESETLLLSLLNDSSYLVRASACDSLSFSCSQYTLESLKKMMNDKTCLVRGYAALSVADVHNNIKNKKLNTVEALITCLKKEKSEWVKSALYSALYSLGKRDYYEKLLESVDSRYYKVRCFALNLIEQNLEKTETDDILKTLLKIKEKQREEKSFAVTSKIKNLILKISDMGNTGDGSVC